MNYFTRYQAHRLLKKLERVEPAEIEKFSFDGITTMAKVARVYDGDTITIVFEFKGEMIKYSCRINGLDTPEIRTKDLEEKKRGYAARDFLKSYIDDKIIKVDLLKFDKYGRLLANVYANVGGTYMDMTQMMIRENHAVAYFGGNKAEAHKKK